jgi:hypothetical protein
MQLLGDETVLEANRDITERRQIEAALRENEERLRWLASSRLQRRRNREQEPRWRCHELEQGRRASFRLRGGRGDRSRAQCPRRPSSSSASKYTGIFGQEAADALIHQEYYCSFEAAILGAYWGKENRGRRRSAANPQPRW